MRGGRRQDLSWATGVNVRLLSHKNGQVELLVVLENVKVTWDGVLTLRWWQEAHYVGL